jgi:hypothetical protein
MSYRNGPVIRGNPLSDLEEHMLAGTCNRHHDQCFADTDPANAAEAMSRLRRSGFEWPWENCFPEMKWFR